jgi:hypothetical protein
MKPIYIIFCLFFVTLTFVAAYQFKRNAFGIFTFVYLSAIFIALSLLSLDPSIVTNFLDLIGLKYTSSFLVVVLIFLFSAYLFYQIGVNTRLNGESVTLFEYLSIFHSQYNDHLVERKNDVLVKIAAYNEEESIGKVLDAMPGNVDVLVIDDASRDNTAEIARQHGAAVIHHLKNMGQGIADITGFLWAVPKGYKYIIEMDADGQHDPSSIPDFIAALENDTGADIVVGSRVLGQQSGDVDFLRKFFLPWYTMMINRASGYHLTDALSGYKAYRCSSLKNNIRLYLPLLETEYIAAELYIKFGRSHMNIVEIPVHIKPRAYGKSHKGSIRYGVAIAWIIFRTLLTGAHIK